MLVLSRKKEESIIIAGHIEVKILDLRGDKVRLGITAPEGITVHRDEIHREIQRQKAAAAAAGG